MNDVCTLEDRFGNCPICDGTTLLYSRDPLRDLYRCSSCGSIIRRPAPGIRLEELRRRIYSENQLPKEDARHHLDTRKKWLHHKRREALLRCRKLGKVIEIGPGLGDFAQDVRELVGALTLVEESETFVGYLHERFSKSDVRVIQGDFMQLRAEQDFDVVMAFQVLEHFERPRDFVRRCFEWLVPGGCLLIEAPSASALWAQVFRQRWNMSGIFDHAVFLSMEGTHALAQKTGADLPYVTTSEPWWEFAHSLLFASMELWKDYRYGHPNWTNKLKNCILDSNWRSAPSSWMGKIFTQTVDLVCPLAIPLWNAIARHGRGTHLLFFLRKPG